MLGVLAFAQSLVNVNSAYPLVVMVSSDVSATPKEQLTKLPLQIRFHLIERIPIPSTVHIGLEAWREALSKLNVFLLEEYEKAIFLDGALFNREFIKFSGPIGATEH